MATSSEQPTASVEPDAPAGEEDSEIVREISLEEFDPKGTLAVAGIYFLILVVMWVLIYFFEFASRVPSIQ